MPTLTTKPLTWFKTNPQVRKTFDEAELRLLGESLRQKQLQPVLARTDGTLIYGERRVRAGKLVGLKELMVIVTDEPLTEAEVRAIQLTENMQRADLTAHEKWQGCEELLELHPEWQGKDLAEHLKLDPSSVTRLLSPSKCIPAWQEALRDGKVGISDCYAASKLAEADQGGLLALKLSGASRDVLESQGRKKRAGNAPAVRVAKIKCQLASGACVVVSGDEMTLDEMIEALAEAAKEAKKARDQGLDAKTFQNVMRDRARAG
jgi:ParB/RepB/Spo0J family partition protein